jgi:serine/threonine protein kinase
MSGLLAASLLKCLGENHSFQEVIVSFHIITSDINQLNLVLDILGSPTEEEIDSFPNIQTRNFLRGLEKRQGKSLASIFTNASPEAIDLLSKLLKFDSSKRITVEEALAHPYLKDLHYPADEVC